MAYIACDKHGGQLASLISHKLYQMIEGTEGNSAVGIKTIKYESLGGEQFSMFVDSDTFEELSVAHNIDLAKTITDEEKLFEITLDFVAICPVCLNDWLANRSNVVGDID
ncbi:hypothetical protein [Rheinheimera nanhaiensis]|uniref:hypothetical protein n=1 Tax=Rheinheimera nanhaiensis TaxID=1163621 RepID=UPI00058C6BBC|nr:hypothetical protein [Rheinheimera nanhaiensis]